MTPDPGSIFGGLFSVCIRDNYVREDRKTMAEGVLFVILGLLSGAASTYFLSLAGILV